jgi:CBS domain-containing protein
MSHFHAPIGALASSPVVAVDRETPLSDIHALLEARNISAVPVMEGTQAIGVVSRTDLLGKGTPRPRRGSAHRPPVDFPPLTAMEVMHPGVLTLPREMSMAAAAAKMVGDRVHRVFTALPDGSLEGVFSTREAIVAVHDARVTTPLEEVMSVKPFTVGASATINDATARLLRAHTHGLVVVDPEGWPVGIFTQRDALLAKSHSPDDAVEDVMSHGMLCLHVTTPLFRAAAQAVATRARRILVTMDKHVVGVMTGFDFARVVAKGVSA